MPSHYILQLLGGFNLTRGEEVLPNVAKGRSPALLTYLILNRHSPQSRQSLAFTLWPDSTDGQARTNLRRELHRLRKLLPQFEDWIHSDRNSLQWRADADCQVDVANFEQAIAQASLSADSADPLNSLSPDSSSPDRSDDSTPDASIDALTTAIDLYKGRLLPDAFDEWIESERDRLHHTFTDALQQLLDLLAETKDYRRAIAYARQLLRIDPLQENAYRSLMSLYADSGDRSSALRIYQDCVTCLDRELGVPPSPTTRQLFEQILREDEAPDPSVLESPSSPPSPAADLSIPAPVPAIATHHPPLVGRDREWRAISQWWDIARSPIPTLLLVGEGGIGKTRLLDEQIPLAQSTGGQVLRGRGFEAEMVRPYGAWTDALRPAISAQVSVPEELYGLLITNHHPTREEKTSNRRNELSDRSRLFDAVAQFLQNLAQSGPLLIQMDDIQWLDNASIALLNYAVRLLSSDTIRFACAARPQELQSNSTAWGFAQGLQREQQLERLELEPLDESAIAELTGQAASAPSTQTIYASSGGNPFFALELAREQSSQVANPSTTTNTPTTHTTDLTIATSGTRSVESILLARLQQLDSRPRELLQWAAALGRGFQPTVLATIAGCPPPQMLTALQQLEEHGLVRPRITHSADSAEPAAREVGYDFAHDIARQTVYQQLSIPRRQLIHRHIAQVLSGLSSTQNANEVAHHAALGQDWALAASAAATATERSLRIFAFSEAAQLAQQGLECCQHLEIAARLPLQLSLLECSIFAGLPPEDKPAVEATIQAAIEDARTHRMRDAEAKGMQVLMMLNFDSGSIVELTENSLVAADLGRGASLVTQAKTLANAGGCLASIGRDMAKAEALLLEAQSLAGRVELEICDIPAGLGMVALHRGDFYIAKQLLRYALSIAPQEHEVWLQSMCLIRLAQAELDDRHPQDALPHCVHLKALAEKMPGGSEGAFADALAALAHYSLQQPDANAMVDRSILALKRLDSQRMLAYVTTYAAEIDLASSDPSSAQRLDLAIERAASAWRAAERVNQPTEMALAGATLVKALIVRGDREAARERLTTLQEELTLQDDSEPLHLGYLARQSLEAAAQAVGDTIASI